MFLLFSVCENRDNMLLAQQLVAKLGCKRDIDFKMWTQSITEAEQALRMLYTEKYLPPLLTKKSPTILTKILDYNQIQKARVMWILK